MSNKLTKHKAGHMQKVDKAGNSLMVAGGSGVAAVALFFLGALPLIPGSLFLLPLIVCAVYSFLFIKHFNS